MDIAFNPGPIGRDSYNLHTERDMMLTHPSRQKSAPKVTPMIVSTPIPGLIEITAEGDTVFRTMDRDIARSFLGALGQTEVRMFSTTTSVQTGADIALLILEREG